MMSKKEYDSKADTLEHISAVAEILIWFANNLTARATKHDASKLLEPEKSGFDELTPILAELEYGSPAYRQTLRQLKPIIQHHYESNSHHPEHFPGGVNDMTLLDITEMFCDWRAAGQRVKDGNFAKSLEINRERFELSEQLYKIFYNTALDFGWILEDE
jgi:hypothetical protein